MVPPLLCAGPAPPPAGGHSPQRRLLRVGTGARPAERRDGVIGFHRADRKSTRLNSSHGYISYAVFCLKKKNNVRLTSSSPPTHPHTLPFPQPVPTHPP